MNGPVVAGHAQQRRRRVEVDAVDGGGRAAAPQLAEQVAVGHVEHADQGALLAGCGQPRA